MAICPEKAISAGQRELGEISWGRAGGIGFLAGPAAHRRGHESAPDAPGEGQVGSNAGGGKGGDAIIDAPPGVSCPAVNAVLDSDVILLVTEPTPFGVYDFKLAWEAFTPLGKPMGAVINRAGLGNDAIYRFCREKGLPILAEIPYDRAIAEAYARGRIIATVSAGLRETFVSLRDRIRNLAKPGQPREAARA